MSTNYAAKPLQTSIPTGYERVSPCPSLNNTELKILECIRPLGVRDELMFYCEPTEPYKNCCTCCGSRNYYAHGRTSDRLVHDCDIGRARVTLQVRVPRYLCNDCGKTFTYPFTTIMPRQPFTIELYEQIRHEALLCPFSKVAERFGISVPTVASILEEYGRELERSYHPTAPRVLGIDEKHIVRKSRGVLVDIEKRKLIEMMPDNKRETMIQAITKLPDYEHIEVVTMDMTSGYVSLVEEILPAATIVIDKFHVVQDLQRKIATTRKNVFKHLKEQIELIADEDEREQKRALLTRMGKDSYLFKYGVKKLPKRPAQISLMSELCETFPVVNTLRMVKEGLERIYDANSREEAEAIYNEWKMIVPAQDPLFSEVMIMKRTMDRWHKYIFNYFNDGCQYTNAATEGANSSIQHVNNQGRGYSFNVLRIKALFQPRKEHECCQYGRKKKVFTGTFTTSEDTE